MDEIVYFKREISTTEPGKKSPHWITVFYLVTGYMKRYGRIMENLSDWITILHV